MILCGMAHPVRNNCGCEVMREILSQRLRQCKKEKGCSQWEAGVYCDITEKAHQNYERITREPRLEILMRIAAFYEVSLDYPTRRTDRKEVNR